VSLLPSGGKYVYISAYDYGSNDGAFFDIFGYSQVSCHKVNFVQTSGLPSAAVCIGTLSSEILALS
jgi:hypothetical protein